MSGFNLDILKLMQSGLFRFERWFRKYEVDPETTEQVWRDGLFKLNKRREEAESQLSQIRQEISAQLNAELRRRSWAKIEPEKLRDLRSLKSYRCSHLKGDGKVGEGHRHSPKDYNVTTHTFPNNITRVRCSGCGRKWFSNEPGWEFALHMVHNSTNSPSSSEILMNIETPNRHGC